MGKVANFFNGQKITLAIEQRKQMLALDAEFEALQAKVTTLESEKLHLEKEVNPLKREVERLQNEVKKTGSHDQRLDEVAEQVLFALANGVYDRERIFATLKISKVKGDYLFDILAERQLVEYWQGMATVTTLGRAYLVKHGLTD